VKESRYEKYITRKPAVISGMGPDGIKFEVPKADRIPLASPLNTGPRLIFNNDMIKEATTKIEYGFIMGDVTLLKDSPDYGAHKHAYAEIFLFLGNDPQNTIYLGAEGEFWLGEGAELEKIKFNTSCSVFVPPGLAHFPLYIRHVKTPVMMGVVVPQVGDLKNTPVVRS
jgi:hypothetical protein